MNCGVGQRKDGAVVSADGKYQTLLCPTLIKDIKCAPLLPFIYVGFLFSCEHVLRSTHYWNTVYSQTLFMSSTLTWSPRPDCSYQILLFIEWILTQSCFSVWIEACLVTSILRDLTKHKYGFSPVWQCLLSSEVCHIISLPHHNREICCFLLFV